MNRIADRIRTAFRRSSLPPSGHPVRQRIKEGLVALSLANLCLMIAWFPPLFDSDKGYFNLLPVNNATLLALAVNLFWFAALAWLVMCALRRFNSRWLELSAHLLFFILLLLPLDFCRINVLNIPDYQVVAFLKKPVVLVSLPFLLAALVWQHRRAAHAAAVLVGILSPMAFFTMARIVLLCLGVEHIAQQNSEPVLPPPGPVHEGQPRVVWIIFDETDERLGFEQRPAWVQLPEFDRLRSESLHATNAYPPGDSTFYSMPQLISGRRASDILIKDASDLTIKLADTGETTSWSKLPSLFSVAHDMGANTALVGWYHPYARLLSNSLNYCAWYPYPGFETSRARTFGAAMLRQISCLTGTFYRRQLYVNIFRASVEEAVPLAANPTYNLMLLHLPMPHRPGIYLPNKDRFTILGMPKIAGYFNNLILADRTLGKIRRAMETSGEWNKSWIILSTDHSWRESRLYDGIRDLRVPFLVKAPGQSRALVYPARLNTVLTRDLILAILRGEVTNASGTVAWLDAHPRTEPTTIIYGRR